MADREEEIQPMKQKIAAVLSAFAFVVITAMPAFADAPPPTNGGNGAGMSGQCTGNPDDRPASCGPH